MIVHPGNCQHIGARSSQQDAFGFSDKDDLAFVAHGGVLSVVADGMGGMSNGGEASHCAVREFLHAYMAKQADETVQAALFRAINSANQAVITLSQQIGADNVGTTLVAAVVHGDVLHWVSVGDSRLYLWHNRQFTQLSADHIYANDLDRDAANGKIGQEDAENHPERRSLTSYLGLDPLDLIDCNPVPFPIFAGDRVLLCSDGFYAAIEESKMTPLFDRDAQRTAEDLVSMVLAKDRPGQDNLTVTLLACDVDSAPLPGMDLESESPTPKKCISWMVVAAVMAALLVVGAASWYFFMSPKSVGNFSRLSPVATQSSVANVNNLPIAASAVPTK